MSRVKSPASIVSRLTPRPQTSGRLGTTAPTSQSSAKPPKPPTTNELLDFYGREASQTPLFPAMDGALPYGLGPEDFFVLRDGGPAFAKAAADRPIVAAAAVWFHGARRRLVADGYSPALAGARPFVNAVSRLAGAPVLPPPGAEIPCAYLACAKAAGNDPRLFTRLVSAARGRTDGANLVLSLHADDPLAAALRGVRAWRYSSELFTVGFGGDAASFDSPPYMEAGAL